MSLVKEVALVLFLVILVSPNSQAKQLGPVQFLPLPPVMPNVTNPLQPFIKSISDGLIQTQKSNPAIKPIIDLILPSTSTTVTTTTTTTTDGSNSEENPTSTTTVSPLERLGLLLPGSSLLRNSFERPAALDKPFENVMTATKLFIPGSSDFLKATENAFNKMAKDTSKLANVVTGTPTDSKREDDSVYYEYRNNDQLDGYRRPKYFSRNCNFRYACELGKLMRPVASPFVVIMEKNRFVQDLQSRYTRAMTYGALHGDCEKYFCLFGQLISGIYDPKKFASGMAELVNRLVNPDLYQDSE